MADLEFVDNPASSDKLLESMRILRPLLSAGASTDLFQSMQTMMDSNVPCSAPMVFSPATISPEDLELPTMLNTTDHEILLSGIGATSLGINCDELSRLLEHSDNWNLPLEQNYPSWKAPEDPSSEHKNVFSQAALGVSHSFTAKDQLVDMKVPKAKLSWCNKKSQQDEAAANAETLTLASSAKQKAASVCLQSAGVRRLGRSKSANDLKQIDSSDNSDAMDDDAGSKCSPNGKNPVSKNLVSERRRRKKLNERLYSLRAIVPKISKMDKASIVGDAIGYVRDLQKQVEDMQGEIITLQSGKDALQDGCSTVGIAPSNGNELGLNMPEHKLLELEVSQMEEQTYHLRIYCKRGPAVFVQLTRALEALDLDIINANLTSVNDRILNTLVVKVKSDEAVTIEALKSMIFGVFPKMGFQIVL